jgi:hypothetical protein
MDEWFDVPAETIFSERTMYPGQRADPSSAITTDTTGGVRDIWETSSSMLIQGTSLETWSFPSPYVECVQMLMKTDGRPMNAKIQVWQGPENEPQTMSMFVEDGRPFCAVVGTPRGIMNTIGIVSYLTKEVDKMQHALCHDVLKGATPKTIDSRTSDQIIKYRQRWRADFI